MTGPAGSVFIDWDLVAPGRRLWDLAWGLHSFVGFWPDSVLDDQAIVQRIVAFCHGAEVDEATRPQLLDVVVERTGEHAALLRGRAAIGQPSFVQRVADGHAEAWESASVHVDANKARWCALLRR